MQYFMSVIADGTELANPGEMDAIDAFNDKLRAGSYWVYANGLAEPNSATVIDGRGEEPIFTDGPFLESKEFLAGFWIIEAPNLDVALKLELVKGANLKMPRYTTPGPITDHFDKKGYEVTTGIGPDLMTGARTAVMEMIDLLSKRFGYSPIDAYMLCSVCADLRISSIVDVPNWVVSFYFPRIVLE